MTHSPRPRAALDSGRLVPKWYVYDFDFALFERFLSGNRRDLEKRFAQVFEDALELGRREESVAAHLAERGLTYNNLDRQSAQTLDEWVSALPALEAMPVT